jgi:Tol biopolymer transport system component
MEVMIPMRRKFYGFVLAAGLLMAGRMIAQQNKQAEIDLQAAMRTETVNGDLRRAIDQYKKISQSKDRSIAAKALLRMADCYQKLGDAESRKVYKEIVQKYSDQKEVVTIARGKLALTGGAGSSGTPSKRLLCPECDFDEEPGTSSTDGRSVVFMNRKSGDLEIANLATHQIKTLVAKDSSGAPYVPVVSNDGRLVAYSWVIDDSVHEQLRVTGTDPGSKPRIVLEKGPEVAYPAPIGWSADGKSILAVIRKGDFTWQLEWLSEAGPPKVIKSLQWRVNQASSVEARLSPDGRYIAYAALAVNPRSYLDFSGPTDQHIYILAADGSGETEVVKTSGVNRAPVWTPDGKYLLFISDRSGSPALWSVAIDGGRVAGGPSLLDSNLGNGQITPKAVNKSGAYEYLLAREDLEQIFVSGIDSSGRKIEGQSAGESLVGTNPSWSPEGKSLAFKRRHHVNDSSVNASSYDLVVHSLESGDERTYPTPLGFTGGEPTLWFQDGKTILAGLGGSQPRNPGSYRVDLASGEWKQSPAGAAGPLRFSTARSAEDTHRYTFPPDVVDFDAATGTRKLIFSTHPTNFRSLRLSPDRRMLAVWYADLPGLKAHLGTLRVDGGEFHELLTVPGSLSGMEWTKDGRTILFAQHHGDKTQLMRIAVQGGMPEFTGIEIEGWIGGMDLSPDGSRLAFSVSHYPGADLWSVDNVLSVLK